MKYQVRKRKGSGDWSMAHAGMIFDRAAAQRLLRNYAAHGYEAELVDVPPRAYGQMFY
jgi:hypothetical protein